jgi:hypothetical protein
MTRAGLATVFSDTVGAGSSGKPMSVVEVSSDSGERAAGRYRRQCSGEHRCDLPLSTRRAPSLETGDEGPQHGAVSGLWEALHGSTVHSQTLPVTSNRP